MNYKNLILASLIGAAVNLVFANVPILNLTNCLLCARPSGPAHSSPSGCTSA